MALTTDDAAEVAVAPEVGGDDVLLGHLAARLALAHPLVGLDEIRRMVVEAYARYEQAPVQNFRLILTERTVRGHLRDESGRRAPAGDR